MKLIQTIPDKSIDLIVTDPPYEFGSKGGGILAKRIYTNSLDSLHCCKFIPEDFLNLIKAKMKKVYIYAFCNKTLIKNYLEWAIKNKCSYDVLVMCKSNPIPAYNRHYMSDLEYIIVIREPGTYFSKEKNIELYRKWFMTSCKKGLHPAEKPLELIKKFIQVGSPESATVLDPFMGSGTTGIACKELNRNFIGIELDDNYFELCKKRIGIDAAISNPIKNNIENPVIQNELF